MTSVKVICNNIFLAETLGAGQRGINTNPQFKKHIVL